MTAIDSSAPLARWARRTVREPLSWILAAALLLRVVGLFWGLPASDGWDNDGVAPRDFLPGVVETFSPGHYFTYPAAHLILLTVLTLPITVVVLVRAPSLAPPEVIAEALKVPYMTSFSIVARVVSVAMSLGIVIAVAKIADEIRGRRAGLSAAAVCAVNVVLTYYAHTTNLDVPYVFWASLALLCLTRAVARGEPRRLRRFAVFAALSVATKDQAYALFLLGTPAVLAIWALFDRWPRANARAVLKEVAIAIAIGLAILLIVDGALTNPSGFRARVQFLAGPASQPYAYYSADARGRLLAFADSVTRFDLYYPLAFAPLVVVGLFRVAREPKAPARAAGLVPLFALVSFTILFNCVARRAEHRFLLPQMVLWAVYAGIGLDLALAVKQRLLRVGLRIASALTFAWALFRCADVDANLLLDPRYEAEAWLAEHVAPGDVIEVHGKSVYLLRFPPRAHTVRVGSDPVAGRNPLFGAEEKQDALGHIDARAPRWIVVSDGYAGRYLWQIPNEPHATGRIAAAVAVEDQKDVDEMAFFQGLFAGKLGYKPVLFATWTSRFWPRLNIHGGTSRDIWIFERSR